MSLKSVAEARRECHARKASPEPQATGTPRRVAPLFRDFVEGAWKEAHFEGYKPSTRKGVRSTLARQVPYAMELVRQAFAAKQPDGAKGSEG